MSNFPVADVGSTPGTLDVGVLAALLIGSLCAASGTLLLKLGANGASALLDFVNPRMAFGLALYAIGSGLWIYAMSRAPLSLVYPFTALTFVLVMLAGFLLLGEKLTPSLLGGSALILTGIGCIALGAIT